MRKHNKTKLSHEMTMGGDSQMHLSLASVAHAVEEEYQRLLPLVTKWAKESMPSLEVMQLALPVIGVAIAAELALLIFVIVR